MEGVVMPMHIDLHNRQVLVTGSTGFVGSRLVDRLLHMGATVVCFARDNESPPHWLSNTKITRINSVSGHLENFEDVKRAVVEHDVELVFHLGAQAIVRAGRVDPLGTFESNIRGSYNLLEACRLYGENICSVVIASSDKAYGDSESLPYTENTPLAARNPYDVSKSCADLIAQSYAAAYGLPVAIARCGNIFGPGDLHWSRLVPGTIRSLLRGERPVIRSDGTLVRDYLYVDDAVDAYLRLARWAMHTSTSDDPLRAFNFSGANALSVLEMTRLLQDACQRRDLDPCILNNSSGEILEQELDCTRARSVLGWRPQHTLISALAATVEWYSQFLRSDTSSSLHSEALTSRATA
jgi:CDP-glucose 4,6-dehydratase